MASASRSAQTWTFLLVGYWVFGILWFFGFAILLSHTDSPQNVAALGVGASLCFAVCSLYIFVSVCVMPLRIYVAETDH